MPKGYWIARVDVEDLDAYRRYVEASGPAFARYGGRSLARGGRHEALEGACRSRNVIWEFPSFDDAVACFRSQEYQDARRHRLPVSAGEFVVVEGVD